jgi:hypothetical protein
MNKPYSLAKIRLPEDVQEEVIKYLTADEVYHFCGVSRVFLQTALRMRYRRVHLDFSEDAKNSAYFIRRIQ